MIEQFEAVLVVAGDDLNKLNVVCNNLLKNSTPSKVSIITNDVEKVKAIIINHQSSIINHQSSIINHQSSIINHQSSKNNNN